MTDPHTDRDDLERLNERKRAARPGRRRVEASGPQTEAPVQGQFEHKCERGFLARESGEYDFLLLAKMIQQVLEPFRGDPAVDAALALGVTPLLNTDAGRRAREQLGARLLYFSDRRNKAFGVRFTIKGVTFQYGLLSGAKSSDPATGENDWVESIGDLLTEHRPAELVTGPMSRLARRRHLFSRLGTLLAQTRTTVRTYEVPHGMSMLDPGGQAQWDALALAAESDYLGTVTRLLTGVVYELKNNNYPRSALGLPPGYVKPNSAGPDQHKVVPSTDPADLARVRKFIELCAGDASPNEIATELSDLGLKTRHPGIHRNDPNLRADQVKHPETLIRVLMQHLPAYLTGTYTFEHEIPLPNCDIFHGFDVHRQSLTDSGFIVAKLDFGVPPVGGTTRV